MKFFEEVKASITNFGAYRDFIRQTGKQAAAYFLILTMILGFLSVVGSVVQFNRGLGRGLSQIKNEVPDFRLSNGELNIETPMPLVTEDKNFLGIIDTTGKTGPEALDNRSEGLVLTKTKAYYKSPDIQLKTIEYSDLGNLDIDKGTFFSWLPLLRFLSIFILIFGPIFFIIGKCISVLVFGLVAFIISKMQNVELNYERAVILAIHALTLPWIVDVIKDYLAPNLPFYGFVYLALAIFYEWKAIEAVKGESIAL